MLEQSKNNKTSKKDATNAVVNGIVYDNLMRYARGLRSDNTTLTGVIMNELSYTYSKGAADFAKREKMGRKKQKSAAQNAYDAAIKAGEIAWGLNYHIAVLDNTNGALLVAKTYNLGKDKKDRAISMVNTTIEALGSFCNINRYLRKSD